MSAKLIQVKSNQANGKFRWENFHYILCSFCDCDNSTWTNENEGGMRIMCKVFGGFWLVGVDEDDLTAMTHGMPIAWLYILSAECQHIQNLNTDEPKCKKNDEKRKSDYFPCLFVFFRMY